MFVLFCLGKPEAFDHMAVIFLILKTIDTVENIIEKEKAFLVAFVFFSQARNYTDVG